MNWAIIKQALKDKRVSILSYCFAAVAMLLLYVAIFPSIKSQIGTYAELVKAYPEGFLKAFGIDNIDLLGNFGGFVATEQFGFVWPILVSFLMLSFAGTQLAGEIEKGTMGTLLSAPVSRAKIFWSKYWAGLIVLVVFVIASVLSIMPLASLFNIDYVASYFMKFSLLAAMFSLAVFSLGMLFSAFSSEKSRVYFAGAGLLLTMYVLNIAASLKTSLDSLKYFSFFYYYNPPGVLQGEAINAAAYVVFLGVSIISVAIAQWWFKHRDIAV